MLRIYSGAPMARCPRPAALLSPGFLNPCSPSFLISFQGRLSAWPCQALSLTSGCIESEQVRVLITFPWVVIMHRV